jgi:hypothetical protein
MARGYCWGPSASEGPQKYDLTMFLDVQYMNLPSDLS